MTTLEGVGIILAVAVTVLLVLSSNAKSRYLRIRTERKTEETRAYFAQLRRRLFELTTDGELAYQSRLFTCLNTLHTQIMRHPDYYKGIAATLAVTVLEHEAQPSDQIVREISNAGPEVRKLVLSTGDGMDMLIQAHLSERLCRTFYTALRLKDEKQMVEKQFNKKKLTEEDQRLLEGKNRLYALAGCGA